jgi:hypothetical protein
MAVAGRHEPESPGHQRKWRSSRILLQAPGHCREHYPGAIWILDFWHAAQHLSQAADIIFGRAPSEEKSAWFERWKITLRDEPGGVAGVIRTLMYYRNSKGLRGKARKDLDKQLNYFRSNADKMQYADYLDAGLPIGSGVTEVGCKELIKARFCPSGMQWNRGTGANVLQLRAIRLSDQMISRRKPLRTFKVHGKSVCTPVQTCNASSGVGAKKSSCRDPFSRRIGRQQLSRQIDCDRTSPPASAAQSVDRVMLIKLLSNLRPCATFAARLKDKSFLVKGGRV